MLGHAKVVILIRYSSMEDMKASGLYEFGDEDRHKFKAIYLDAFRLWED